MEHLKIIWICFRFGANVFVALGRKNLKLFSFKILESCWNNEECFSPNESRCFVQKKLRLERLKVWLASKDFWCIESVGGKLWWREECRKLDWTENSCKTHTSRSMTKRGKRQMWPKFILKFIETDDKPSIVESAPFVLIHFTFCRRSEIQY